MSTAHSQPVSLYSLKWAQVGIALTIAGAACVVAALIFGDGQHVGMFTPLQWALYGMHAAITFASYHAIPAALDVLRKQGNHEAAAHLVTSTVFTVFIRACGNDHIIMYAGMLVHGIAFYQMGSNGHNAHGFTQWLVIASIWLVATVSMLSAIAVNRAAREAVSNE